MRLFLLLLLLLLYCVFVWGLWIDCRRDAFKIFTDKGARALRSPSPVLPISVLTVSGKWNEIKSNRIKSNQMKWNTVSFSLSVGLPVCLAEWLIRLQLHTWRMRDMLCISMITHSPRWPANSSKFRAFALYWEHWVSGKHVSRPKAQNWPKTLAWNRGGQSRGTYNGQADKRTGGQMDKRTGGQFWTFFAQYV